MHELADKFIMQLLGLESERSTTEFSHLTSTQRSDDPHSHTALTFDNDDVNNIALDVVKQALIAQNDVEDEETEKSLVNDDIDKRVKGLTSNVVKTAIKKKLDLSAKNSNQSLLSQDVLYLEKRVNNLASNILTTMVPEIMGTKSDTQSVSGSISSKVSTLPDNYEDRVNQYTVRIIQTLLRMKRIMPHPKSHKATPNKNPLGTIAKCINFDELYKAPKDAFKLSNSEITGLAQAMADRINFMDQNKTPSPQESPRDGLVKDLVDNILEKQGNLNQPSFSPRTETSSGASSKLAFTLVGDTIKKGNFTRPLEILSDAGSSLADEVINAELAKAQQHAEESAESALDEMAKDAGDLADILVKHADEFDQEMTSESDSVAEIADRLAGLIVDYGEDKYLKENLDKKAKIVSREVTSIAHDLIKELLQSAKSSSLSDSKSGSYVKLHGSASKTSTLTLESVISEAIGALAQTCIKSDPSNEFILRTKSEIALRNLLRALQNNFQEDEEDARSVGSSGASVLADDIASTIVSKTHKQMNLYSFGTETKPDWQVTRGIQVDGKPINEQANQLMTAILGEINQITESEPTTQSTTGYEDMDEAATQVSKLLCKKLVPQLIEHFKPPSPPPTKEMAIEAIAATKEGTMATTSCFTGKG